MISPGQRVETSEDGICKLSRGFDLEVNTIAYLIIARILRPWRISGGIRFEAWGEAFHDLNRRVRVIFHCISIHTQPYLSRDLDLLARWAVISTSRNHGIQSS